MARPNDADQLPRPFGPYLLLRRIAVGGMAEVYVAKARGIGGFEKLVALKVIHPRFSEDEQFVQMLVDEAKLSVVLTHANIAQTFDLGCVEGKYFIMMEYVEGADASRLLRRAQQHQKRLPIAACLYIASEVLNGLDYAHRKTGPDGRRLNVIHRDVSPQNVLLSMSGEVKIADFGIAKAALRSSETEVGVIKGKYYYMSPEQAWADPMDHRSDIFSTGVLLYELLTGQMLYALEDNLPALLDKVRKARIEPPSRLRPDIPAELDEVILKALARNPDDRWSTAHDFASELQRVLYQLDPTFGGSRMSRLMDEYFGPESPPSVEVRRPDSARPTALEVIPKMQSREFVPEENSVIFTMRSSSIPAAPSEPVTGRPPAMPRVVAETTNVRQDDPRGREGARGDEDDEDEATTFYTRDALDEVASRPTPVVPRGHGVAPPPGVRPVDKAHPLPPPRIPSAASSGETPRPATRPRPEDLARPNIEIDMSLDEPSTDDATVVDSAGDMARKLDEMLGHRPRLHSDEPVMAVHKPGADDWAPPRPKWDPLPFVGPSLELFPLVPLSAPKKGASAKKELPRPVLVAGAIALVVVAALVGYLLR